MKKIIFVLSALCLILTIGFSSCKKEKSGKDIIAVSYDAHKYILEQIAGDDYEIKVLLPQGSDPETYEPDIRTMAGLENASVYFYTATLGFENRLVEILKNNYPQLPIVDVSQGIEIINGTHKHAHADAGLSHAHSDGDPHLLSSIKNVRIISSNILTQLNNLNSANSDTYQNNYDAFMQRLDSLENEINLEVRPYKGSSFVSLHPAMSYFARDYSLNQISLERDGKEASPKQLQERLNESKASSPRILFYEQGHNEKGAKHFANQMGIPSYPLNLEGYDFLSNLQEAAKRFASQND